MSSIHFSADSILVPSKTIKALNLDKFHYDQDCFQALPFDQEQLKCDLSGRILVPVFTMSIRELLDRAQHLFLCQGSFAWFYDDAEAFANDIGKKDSWYMIGKEPKALFPGIRFNLSEALDILDQDEQLPSARVLVYTAIAHFLINGERLFRNFYALTSDVDSRGRRVCVGYNDTAGIDIISLRDHMSTHAFV